MSYFTVSIHQAYMPPELTGWHGILDQRTLCQKKRNLIPKHTVFKVMPHMQTVLTDIIMHPCFMVSKKVMEVIKRYDSTLTFERLVISEPARKETQTYYMPILPKLDVLTSNSRLGRDQKLTHIEMNGNRSQGKAIFQIEKQGHLSILMSLDLVESLLRRGCIGIGLTEVDVID